MSSAKSLNAIGSLIANIVNQAEVHAVHERAKIMFLQHMATIVSNRISNKGLQEHYTLPLLLDLVPDESSKYEDDLYRIKYRLYKTKDEVPVPMRYRSASPFVSVCVDGGNPISYGGSVSTSLSLPLIPHEPPYKYYHDNKVLYIKINDNLNFRRESNFKKVEIRGIWENPEQVIGYYKYTDNQDYDLPFPTDMIGKAIRLCLTIGFNIPKDDPKVKDL